MTWQKLLLKDTSGKKSVTVTAFVLGFIVVNAKLIFSGMTLGGFELSPFTGGEYAAAVEGLSITNSSAGPFDHLLYKEYLYFSHFEIFADFSSIITQTPIS